MKTLTTALLALSLAGTGAAQTLTVIVPEDAEFTYANATAATDLGAIPDDWWKPDFDDSGWFVGLGPFGTSNANGAPTQNPACGGPAPNTPTLPANTLWSVQRDPYLRTRFQLAEPTDLTIWFAVDNGVCNPGMGTPCNGEPAIYLNGFSTERTFNAEGPARRWEHILDVPRSFTRAGENVLAIRLEDHGSATAFAMVITEDDPCDNLSFGDNQPPVFLEPTPVETCALGGSIAAMVGIPVDFTITVTSPEDDQLTTLAVEGAVPGLSCSQATPASTVTMSCTFVPQPNDVGLRELVFRATDDGTPQRTSTLRLCFDVAPEGQVCAGERNSTGATGQIEVLGSLSVGADDLTLRAAGLPSGTMAQFVYSPDTIEMPFGGGVLCVGHTTLGWVARMPVGFADDGGLYELPVDYDLPRPPVEQLLPGTSWTFQAWYRDGLDVNFSNAVRLTFRP